jgi:uncharacterized protein YggU (UPF0235/DUF167 family)
VVQVAAPPAEGAANEELLVTLASALGVPRRHVSLVHGAGSRTKIVEIAGVGVDDLRARLDRAMHPDEC